MQRPEISVIMPAYNHEQFVGEAIESVLLQTFKDFEFIIINDGSTDDTQNIIKKYDDIRIHNYIQENQGARVTHNKGIELSKGTYTAFINSDDVYHPERLEILFNKARNEDLNFVITDIALIDQNSNIINDPGHWWIRWYEYLKSAYGVSESPEKAFLAGNYTISTSNFFFRSDIVKTIGLFRPFTYIIDYDFAFRAALHDSKRFKFLHDKKLLSYRLHGGNTILENPLVANYETFSFLTNAIKDIYGQDVHIPIDHLDKVKRYITKELVKRHRRAINKTSEEYHELDRRYQEMDRKYQELQLKYNNIVFSQLQDVLNYNKKLRRKSAKPLKMVVTNVDELQKKLASIIGNVDIISFDVFDTIFERDIDPPNKVKEIVANRVSNYLLEKHKVHYSPEKLLKVRDKVEIEIRHRSLSIGSDFECRYSDIVREMVIRILGHDDRKLVRVILEQELAVENEVLYVKRGMRELLQWLKSKGKKIIAISDMYLDRESIEDIIRNKSLHNEIDDIYVSSEIAICKYSGNLFKHVLLEENILPSRMVHIGDNKSSDYRAPLKLGINAVFFKDKEHLKRKYILKTYNKLATHNPYWRGRHLLQLIRPPLEMNGFFYPFGFSFLGPVYATFVYSVIEAIKKNDIKILYFVAREGELFLHIFQLLAPHFLRKDQIPITKYVYLTRKSTALASLYKGLPHEKAIIPLYNPKQQGLYSLCNVYGLPHHELIQKAREHGFQDIKAPIFDWNDERFKRFISDKRIQEIVVHYAQRDRDLLEGYLTQIGFFRNDPVAFVDIGWNATIQKFIQDAFVERADYPHVYGLYLGFRNGMKHHFDEMKNTIIGMLYDDRLNDSGEQIINRFEEIFEEGARALHPTTMGYKRNFETGALEPVFKEETAPDRITEVSFNGNINKLQKGVLDFSREFIRALELTNYNFQDIKPFILTIIERLVAYPNADEVKNLMKLKHAEDFGYENIMDFNSEKVDSLHAIMKPKRFIQKIRYSNWSYGTAQSSKIPGITLLLRCYDLFWGHQ